MIDELRSILVVDDEVDTCRNLSDIFSDLGYRVDTAHDGQAAIALVKQRRYDIALVDLMMPGMNGQELCTELAKLRAGMVTLLVTAYPNNLKKDAAVTSDAWCVVQKPVELAQLLQVMDEAIESPLVLVVDDDPDYCRNLRDVLSERGCRVCVAHSTQAAADRLREGRFQMILLDFKLPDGDGLHVLQHARQTNPQAQVLMITGFRSQMSPQEWQLLGADALDVLDKPLEVPRLLSILAQLSPGGRAAVRSEESSP